MKKFTIAIVIISLMLSVSLWAQDLKQSTAVSVIVGPLLDSVDGKTPVTTLDVNDITAAVFKGSSRTALTLTASGGDNDITDACDGYWLLELTATDTATAGNLKITLRDDDVFLAQFHDFLILPANIYDSKYSTDKLQVDMVQINGGATDGYNATLKLRCLDINNDSGYGVRFEGSTSGAYLSGGDYGLSVYGGHSGALFQGSAYYGVYFYGSTKDIKADEIDAIKTNVDATLADTNDIQEDWAGVLADFAAILEDTGTTLPEQITGLNNVSIIEVNRECDTAISDAALATAANLQIVDNNVDAILEDTTGLNGDAMRGTDSALLAASVNVSAGIVESNIKQINGGATDGYNATLKLKSLMVHNSAGTGIDVSGSAYGIDVIGWSGIRSIGTGSLDTGIGLELFGTGNGLYCYGSTNDIKADEIDAIKTNVDATLADTNDIQDDWAGVLADLAATLADSNELQTDWYDGGRLDLIVDAIKNKTDNLPADPASETNVNANETKIDSIPKVPSKPSF